MSATFNLMKGLGTDAVASASNTSWIVSLLNIDSANANMADYPVGRPGDSGTQNANHSYESWLFLYMTQAPENRVTNFKLWGPGPNTYPADGVEILLSSSDYNNGVTPADTNLVCDEPAVDHYSPGTSVSFQGTCEAVGHSSGFCVMQMRVYASASLGNVQGETCVYHLSYDES